MSDLRQAAQQALEALESAEDQLAKPYSTQAQHAITALRAALAEPDSDYERGFVDGMNLQTKGSVDKAVNRMAEPEQEPVATKQMLQWVEHLKRLSDDGQHMSIPGLSSGACWELAIELEQFIKNTAPTPQREHITDGSPCWCNPDVFEEDGGNVIVHNYDDNWQQYAKPGETAQRCIERHRSEQDALMKLYATPRKPLTDEEIWNLAANCLDSVAGRLQFARAVEAAHGIGEQHE